jgi:hypothetical protein
MVKLKPCMMKEVILYCCRSFYPVSVLGLDGAATAGDKFNVFEEEKKNKLLLNVLLMREQSGTYTTSYYYLMKLVVVLH